VATLDGDTLTGLRAALTALLPAPAQPELRPAVSFRTLRLSPTGLGGYVSPARNPQNELIGDRTGRRVEGQVVVAAKGASLSGIDDAVNAVVAALLGEPVARRQQGVLAVELVELGPRPAAEPAAGDVASRDAVFRVLYEFVHTPAEAGDLIEVINLDLDLTPPEGP